MTRSRALPGHPPIVLFTALAALSTACAGPDAFTVVVDVITDYSPGVQFDTVVVTLASDADGTRLSELETEVTTETDGAGFRAAEFGAISGGFHHLEVRLLAAGAEVARQRLTLAVFSATAVVVRLNKPPCFPQAEACNATDDDCDGEIDEDPVAEMCSLAGAAEVACDAGVCAVVTCEDGLADCDADPGSGCEVDLRADSLHCGSCGAACEIGLVCDARLCRGRGGYHADREIEADRALALPDGFLFWTVDREGSGGPIPVPLGPRTLRFTAVGYDLSTRWSWTLTDSNSLLDPVGLSWFEGQIHVDADGDVHLLVRVENEGTADARREFEFGSLTLSAGETRYLDVSVDAMGELAGARELTALSALDAVPMHECHFVGFDDSGGYVVALTTWTGVFRRSYHGVQEHLIRYDVDEVEIWRWTYDHGNNHSSLPTIFGHEGEVSARGDLLVGGGAGDTTIDLGGGPIVSTADVRIAAVFEPDGALLYATRFRGLVRGGAFRPDGGSAIFFQNPAAENGHYYIEQRGADGSREGGDELPFGDDDLFGLWFGVGSAGDVYASGGLRFGVDLGGGLRRPLLETLALAAYSPDMEYRYDRVFTGPGSVAHREMVVSGDYILLRATLTGEHDFGGGVRTGDASPWAVVLRD